jgi:hypothetical protein
MTDTELLDLAADLRIVDGINDIDIDEWVLERIERGASEEEWKRLWRHGLRAALTSLAEGEGK